jgi:class 3 adenylate cyclase/pSer/pThr/pTyr-binding forkhead associated (FHA) protein
MEQHPNDSVTRILDVARSAGSAAELEKFRRNVTVLFTDMKGSTAYFEKYGDAAGLLLVHRLNSMFGDAVGRHGGRVIKTIGDAVMACFDDKTGAVSAAIEMQQELAADSINQGSSERILVRIGLNYGLGIVKSNDVFGDVVNVASRVESAAAPDQILISNSLYHEVGSTGKFRLRAAGKFALKGKAEEQELFEVMWRDGDEDELHSASHSLVMQAPQLQRVAFRLAQIRNDGKQAREFDLTSQLTIGRLHGDVTFPQDGCMLSPHVKLVVEKGQLFVEPVGDAATFFSLVGPWRLQDGDLVRMGSQVMAFRVNSAALEMASMNGTDIAELSAVLQYPVAEFVSTIGDNKRYSVLSGNVSFGRTKATHTFPTDGSMSRSHAKAFHRGEDFFLEDMGSTNGTFVMARGKTPIPDGVTLLVGGQLLKVVRQA